MPQSESTLTQQNLEQLPKFQQLQYQFAAHIRDPENIAYDNMAVRSEAPIEQRRLTVYEELLFNNISSFLSGLFCYTSHHLGEQNWQALIRDFMRDYRAQTPLFHEMGEEFLLYLQQANIAEKLGLPWLFELAHFEWVELHLSIDGGQEQNQAHTANSVDNALPEFDLSQNYQLSDAALLLNYNWPVHLVNETFIFSNDEPQATFLMVYRNEQQANEPIEWFEISAPLFQFLHQLLDNLESPQTDLNAQAWMQQFSPEDQAILLDTLQKMLVLNLILPVQST